MRWVLLLRAVNLGAVNKLRMADLRALLEDLGYDEVKTYLNSGNATFEAGGTAKGHAQAVEAALLTELGLDVRACVRRDRDIKKALDGLPDLPGYQSITVLFDKPTPARLAEFLATDWSPEHVEGNDQCLYIGYQNAARTKLSMAKAEKLLGVSGTARTPATLRKLVQ
jgi:uncharacterized protein (DUF1697 family)